MPLPEPDITQQQRIAAFRAIEAASANDPDPVVRTRCLEILDCMRGKSKLQRLLSAATVAQNVLAPQADRLRALDIIFELIKKP